ncbi:MAG: hypothetical protein NXI08_06900 [bacterium]|nr:hypothetical protein [bacterium]
MGANNFKLFEVVNETIDDIYDFLVRYIRTFWIILFRFRSFIELKHEDQDYLKIVRPFNYLLFSFILLLLGLELVSIPYEEYYSESYANEQYSLSEGSRSAAGQDKLDDEKGMFSNLQNDLVSLNTTSIIMKFLPTILFFILISQIIEVIYRKLFKKPEAAFGSAYLYSIGFSCSAFAFMALLLYGIYATAMFLEIFEIMNLVEDLEVAIVLYGLLLTIFPAFLISRVLKIEEIHFFKRILSFFFLIGLNIMITLGYLLALVNAQENNSEFTAENAGVEFKLLGMEREGKNLQMTLIHRNNSDFIFKQGSTAWINAVNYYDTLTYGIFLADANFITGKQTNNFLHLNPNRILELELEINNEMDYQVFDSLFTNTQEVFRIELEVLKDAENYQTAFIDFIGENNSE